MPTYLDENGNPIGGQATYLDDNGNPIAPPVRPRSAAPANPAATAAGLVANLGNGIPFYNDMVGATGVAKDLPDLIQHSTPQNFAANASSRFHDYAQASRDRRDAFLGQHPNIGNFAQGTGAALPVLLSMGTDAPALAAAKAPGLLGQVGRGAVTGSTYGAAYGAGSGGTLQERLGHADAGAGVGAVLGGAAPLAVNAASTAIQEIAPRLGRIQLPNIAEAANSGTGAFGGQLFSGAGRRPPPVVTPSVPPASMNTIERLADRARMSPDQVDSAFAGARNNPQGQVTADLFGDPGVRSLRAMAQAPGQTGEAAANVAQQRFQAASDRIIGSLRRNLQVSESRSAAISRLKDQYAAASANLYNPIWRSDLTPAQETNLETAFKPYADTPVFRDASQRAQRIFNLDVANGNMQGGIGDNFARYAHYIKMGLDEAISKAPEGARGVGATELRGIHQMRANILSAMDQNIPGYAEARARWGGIASAEDALTEGADFLSMNSDEVQSRVQQMTPFELEHARIGMADAISHSVGRSGKVVGNANVANSQLLNSPEGQRRLAAVFDTPTQAADFLDTVTSQNRLMRNAGQWGTGSQTFSNETHGADNIFSAVAENGIDLLRGDTGRVLNRAGRQLGNLLTSNGVERDNNTAGADLLRRVDNSDAATFAQQVVAELRRRAQARTLTAATSQGASSYSAIQAGRRRR